MKIIIIDDDVSSISILANMLKGLEYEVVLFDDPQSAIDYLSDNEAHLVVTDILMPNMDGIDVLKTIKHFHPNIPVIVFTGMPVMSTAIYAVNNGAYAFFKKPIAFKEFVQTIEKIEKELLL